MRTTIGLVATMRRAALSQERQTKSFWVILANILSARWKPSGVNGSKMRNPNNTGFRNAKNTYYRAHGYQRVGAYDLLTVGEEGMYYGVEGSPMFVEVLEVPDSMMIFDYKFRILGPAHL